MRVEPCGEGRRFTIDRLWGDERDGLVLSQHTRQLPRTNARPGHARADNIVADYENASIHLARITFDACYILPVGLVYYTKPWERCKKRKIEH
jgi:hypothetical protein